MFSVASASAAYTTFSTNVGSLLSSSIAIILVGAAALIGLGFAYRKTKSKVTGKKF